MREPMRIFGYGSLVWRPSFEFTCREVAHAHGFVRRFWQGSTDHRGVPGAPGRVVTLVSAPADRCTGVVYSVAPERAESVLALLDVRERGGYERCCLEVELAGGERVAAATWIALPSNPGYLGEAPLAEVAAQIRASRGPSGTNADYALRLAAALAELSVRDAHVEEVAALVGGAAR